MKDRVRMKRTSGSVIAGLALAALASAASAQSSTKLFDPVPIAAAGAVTDPTLAISFGTSSRVLACEEEPIMAVLSSTSDGLGSLIVDNYLTVNGKNVCPGVLGCGTLSNCARSCFFSFLSNTGNLFTSYVAVAPLDISGELEPGRQLVTFDLLDWGVLLASSELWLVTNCEVLDQVAICHKPGTRAEKSLLISESAVPGHLGHGDLLDPCP